MMKILQKFLKNKFWILFLPFFIFQPVISATCNTNSAQFVAVSNQYFNATDSTSLSITGNITIEAWIKTTSIITSSIVSKYYTGTADRSYGLDLQNTGKLYFYYTGDVTSGNTNDFNTDNAVILNNNEWYHVKVKVNSATKSADFYVNGSAVADTLTNDGGWTSIANSAADLNIGASRNGTSQYFNGLIDDVRIYNDLIDDDYQTELTGTETNLVAYWKLNNSVLDETSNNNDLTNNNSVTFPTDVPFAGTCGGGGSGSAVATYTVESSLFVKFLNRYETVLTLISGIFLVFAIILAIKEFYKSAKEWYNKI